MAKTARPAFRVHTGTPRPDPKLLDRFVGVPTGNLCDAMDRFGALDHAIRPLDPARRLCGPALTVRTRPGDNLVLYKALEVVQPGYVLVVATYDHVTGSTFGDLVALIAKKKGAAGIVSDGLCRDAAGIRALGLPVFVRGTSPSSPFKEGPGEINAPISCGGVAVHPGDVVVGDEDGVVVVPYRDLEAVAGRLEGIARKEEKIRADIEAGRLIPPDLAAALDAKGVQRVN